MASLKQPRGRHIQSLSQRDNLGIEHRSLPLYEPPAHLSGQPYERGINVIGSALIQAAGPPVQDILRKHGATGLIIS